MQKFTTALLGLIIYAISTSAQKIEYDKNDDFNGVRTIKITSTFLVGNYWNKEQLNFYGQKRISGKDSSVALIMLVFVISPREVTSIDNKDKVIFKYLDGTVSEFTNESGYNIVSSSELLPAAVYIDDMSILKLSNNRVEKIRIETSKRNYDFEIPEKKQAYIAKTVELLAAIESRK